MLLNHREETPGDHVANAVILEALGLKQENASKRLDTNVSARNILSIFFTLGISPKFTSTRGTVYSVSIRSVFSLEKYIL